MLHNTAHPILRPTPVQASLSKQNVQELSLAPPPPSRRASHHRSRTTVDLPPLFTRTPSASPTRSSNFLPFLRNARDRSISPERVTPKEAAEFDVGLTPPSEDPADLGRSSGKVEKLASWFNGCSDPVNISLVPSPSREKLDPIAEPEMDTIFSGSTDSIDTYTRRPNKRTTMYSESNSSTSRFSLFKKPLQSPMQMDTTTINELADIDAFAALFPTGQDDIFSTEGYKQLQMNAENTIKKLQQALKQQTQTLGTVRSQKIAQADDMEATKIQSEAMKSQLTEMADQVKEQEEYVKALKAELALRPASFQAEVPPQPTVRIVSGNTYRYKKRMSDMSMTSQSDNDSDVSSAISVFSEAQSAEYSPGTSIAASPVLKHATPASRQLRPSLMWSDLHHTQACQRCHGVPASEAWDVIDIMKKEKVALKERIEVLEIEYESALNDLVGGLTITVDKTRGSNPAVLSPLDEMQQRIRVSLAQRLADDE